MAAVSRAKEMISKGHTVVKKGHGVALHSEVCCHCRRGSAHVSTSYYLARRSLSSTTEHKRFWNITVASPVGLSVCLSGKCTVAKRLIGSGCRLGWSVGSVEEWMY